MIMNTRLALLTLMVAPTVLPLSSVEACTIFVLTDTNRALFCNNEDWSNPRTRIWFVPAGDGHLGRAYVGFDNGWAQGGLNTAGLAFDWVAGFKEKWEADPRLKSVKGNPSERMLETCATIQDAIAFYRTSWEPGFSYAKILVADRSGNSVIIGSRDGQLQVEPASRCRGFGYGQRTLDKLLVKPPEPSVTNGAAILRACLQDGQYATKYSSIFDLKSGDIFLFQFPEQSDAAKLNLAIELKKGGHYYDIPEIRQQVGQPPLPLLDNMQRFFLDQLKPIPDNEPKVTAHLRAMTEDACNGAMRPGDYTPEFWKELAPQQKKLQADLTALGKFESLTLVGRTVENGNSSYRYRLEFQKATVLGRYVLEESGKVAFAVTESFEPKPASGEIAAPK
jgi:hypothetical protein